MNDSSQMTAPAESYNLEGRGPGANSYLVLWAGLKNPLDIVKLYSGLEEVEVLGVGGISACSLSRANFMLVYIFPVYRGALQEPSFLSKWD